jgi:hypothetical protein
MSKKKNAMSFSDLAKTPGFVRNVEALRAKPLKFKTLEDAQKHADLLSALEAEYKPMLQAERNQAVLNVARADHGKKFTGRKGPAEVAKHIRVLLTKFPELMNKPGKLRAKANPKIGTTMDGHTWATAVGRQRKKLQDEGEL